MVLRRILVVAGLEERTLHTILSPILQNEDAVVDVIRSNPGVPREGLSYLCPPRIFRRNIILSLFWKILIVLRVGLTARFTCVLAVFSIPHLYLAFLASILARRPLLQYVIASFHEFKWHGPVIEKMTIAITKRASRIFVSDQKTVRYLVEWGIPITAIVMYRRLDSFDLTHFFPSGKEKSVDLIVVARLSPEKHIEVFVDIINRLRDSIPEIKASIVGDGEMRNDLEDYVLSLDLSENIKFHGWVSSTVALNQLLNSAKIFVLNSGHEGGPLTIIEAMAAGLCCVSSNVGEVQQIITNENNGFIVERYDDVETYVSIIRDLLKDPERLRKIQERASHIGEEKNPDSKIRLWKKIISSFSSIA